MAEAATCLPLAHLRTIDLAEANAALVLWEHRMGPCNRPNQDISAQGLFAGGELVAVTVTASLIRETCAGLTRAEAVELARLCAARPALCRVMLRMWREFVFVPACEFRTWRWAVSYQDERVHTGDTYRFDGWVRLARSRSGTDKRSGRCGRNKTIWGWHADPMVRAAAAL